MVLFTDCGVGWRLGSAGAEIECSNESSGQHTASEGVSRARRATELAETAGAGRWVSSESVPTENPRRFQYLEHDDLQENFPRFNNMCTTAVLLCQYRHCRRPPWEKRKIRDYDRSTRTLTQILIGMLWCDQCLDAVTCEGFRLIRPIWLLYLERL